MSQQSTAPFAGVDLTGKVFGRWTVLGFAGRGPRSVALWLCRCECGTERVVVCTNLKNGRSTNCGCFASEACGNRSRKHGMFRSPEYAAWQNMKKRCLDSSYRRFPDYGGRGITICARWLESFENFFADMGPRPSADHSIERKDN